MKLEWTEIASNKWHGRTSESRFVTEIEYSEKFNSYFVEGAKYSYDSLRAAKIAAAKLKPGFIAEEALYA